MSTVRPSSKQVRKNIYTDIPQQFPGIYREEGPIFVDFVKSYYEYIDTRQNDFRDAFAVRDIDTTFERFLLYFKKKYLNVFFLNMIFFILILFYLSYYLNYKFHKYFSHHISYYL